MPLNINKCKELVEYSHSGNFQRVNEILDRNDVEINYVARFTRGSFLNETAITHASISGHHEIVRLLLEKGASTKCEKIYQKSPLFHAIENRHEHVALVLVELGSLEIHEIYQHPKGKGLFGAQAIRHALKNEMFDVVNGLLQAGAYTMPFNSRAYRYEYEEIATDLFSYGDVSVVNELFLHHRSAWWGDSRVVRSVCYRASPEVVELFIDKGGELNQQLDSLTKHLGSIRRKDADDTLSIRKILLEKVCNLKMCDISWIYQKNKFEDLNEFLEQGNDINMRGKLGITPLMIAAQLGDDSLVGRMIDAGADITAVNAFGSNALAMAARVGNDKVMERLSAERSHLLFLDAVVNNDIETVREFVNLRTIDVNHADKNGKNALMHVSESGNMEMAEVILGKMIWTSDLFTKFESAAPVEMCADINAKDKSGNTALAYAIRNDSSDMVSFLLKNKADINAKNNSGDSVLALSCQSGNLSAAKTLLLNKADINAKNWVGNTALMISCINKNAEMVELLMSGLQRVQMKSASHGKVKYEYKNSLDVDIKNNLELTALMLSYLGEVNHDIVNYVMAADPRDIGPFDIYGVGVYGYKSLIDLEDDGCDDDFSAGVKKQRITFLRKDHEDEMQGIDDQQEVQLAPLTDFWNAYAEDTLDVAANAGYEDLSFNPQYFGHPL